MSTKPIDFCCTNIVFIHLFIFLLLRSYTNTRAKFFLLLLLLPYTCTIYIMVLKRLKSSILCVQIQKFTTTATATSTSTKAKEKNPRTNCHTPHCNESKIEGKHKMPTFMLKLLFTFHSTGKKKFVCSMCVFECTSVRARVILKRFHLRLYVST